MMTETLTLSLFLDTGKWEDEFSRLSCDQVIAVAGTGAVRVTSILQSTGGGGGGSLLT